MDLLNCDATELSDLMDRRKVSAEEVMRACLAQVDAVNGPINAIVSRRDPEVLLDEARLVDSGPRRGFLSGLPMAVKDLANVAGLPTSYGSTLFRDTVPALDDLVVGRMREAGAIFIGKTNTPEWGLGSHTVNPVFGPTHNPYAAGLSAGGSSGGAAAALAARMQWVCDGSDMMGSLRNPAGWCNVYGFRPSFGRVPADPAGEAYLHPLATLGPMARSVSDLAALLDVMAGRDPRLPFGLDHAAMAPRLDADLTGRRIAWLGDWGGAYPMEEGVLATCEAALPVFEEIGCIVEPVAPPLPADRIWQAWVTLRAFANAARLGPVYADPAKRAHLKPEAIWEIEQGLALSAMEVQAASALRSEWLRAAVAFFDSYDAFVLPTAQVWPFSVDIAWPDRIAGVGMDTYHRWMEVVVPASLLGLPALAVPAGFGASGLPMGLQIVGAPRADLEVLQIGQAWHAATRWPQTRPPQP